MRRIIGQNQVTFGTGEDKLHNNKIKYGTERGHFLGQEKLTYGHDKTNFGIEQGDFLGQEKSILGLFEMNYGT
jgi:hypothetical protein